MPAVSRLTQQVGLVSHQRAMLAAKRENVFFIAHPHL